MTDTICDNIKRITTQKRLLLGSVEKAAGVSEGYLSRCKAGACQLSVDRARKFAEVLHVPFDDLLREHHGWSKKEPWRSKGEVYVCPYCGESCYCRNPKGCSYRYCPNCGKEV